MDLIAVPVVTVAAAVFVFVPPLNGSPLRPVVTLAFALLVPGYTLVAALLPSAGLVSYDAQESFGVGRQRRTSKLLERLVFGFGVSVALVILLGLALGLTAGGIGQARLFGGLTLVTALAFPVALVRNGGLALSRESPAATVLRRLRPARLGGPAGGRVPLTFVLVAVTVVAVMSVGTGAVGQQDPSYTELYLVAENDEGEFTASEYPDTLTPGEPESLAVGVDNREGESTQYTVLVVLQAFEGDGASAELVAQSEQHRFTRTLDDGETATVPHEINLADSPSGTDRAYRLTYLLYVGDPPATPSVDNAYREAHLWVDIEAES